MSLQSVLASKDMSMYKLSQLSGVPKTTVIDICSGKSSIGNCNANTVMKLSKALGCSMEDIMEEATETDHYEHALPAYLQLSLRNMKEAWRKKRSKEGYIRFDCDYCELQSDINTAEIGGEISPDQAWYLRNKYLKLERI